jgi:NADH:ubiquinone oxidoreductase subunit
MKISTFFTRCFTWWNGQTFGTQLWTALYGEFVGEDEFGNRYYPHQGPQDRSDARLRAPLGDLQRLRRGLAIGPPGMAGCITPSTCRRPRSNTGRAWQKPHRANPTGTPAAQRPTGSTLAQGRRPKATGDYKAWVPGARSSAPRFRPLPAVFRVLTSRFLGCGVYSPASRIAGRQMPRHRLPLLAIALLAAFAAVSPVTGAVRHDLRRPAASRRPTFRADARRSTTIAITGARQQAPSVWPREPQVGAAAAGRLSAASALAIRSKAIRRSRPAVRPACSSRICRRLRARHPARPRFPPGAGQRQPRGTPGEMPTTPAPPNDEVVIEPPAQKIPNNQATFSGLDKITGRIISFDVAINETVQFGALQVTPRVCYTRPPTETPNTDAFLEVDEITLQGEIKRLFTGWMFAASPGLHAIEHPIYDVWLADCKGPQRRRSRGHAGCSRRRSVRRSSAPNSRRSRRPRSRRRTAAATASGRSSPRGSRRRRSRSSVKAHAASAQRVRAGQRAGQSARVGFVLQAAPSTR